MVILTRHKPWVVCTCIFIHLWAFSKLHFLWWPEGHIKCLFTNGNVTSSSVSTASQHRRWLESALLLLPILSFRRAAIRCLLILGRCCAGVTRGSSGLLCRLCHGFSPLWPRPRQQSGHGPQRRLHVCPGCCCCRSGRRCFNHLGDAFFSYFVILTELWGVLRLDVNTGYMRNPLCVLWSNGPLLISTDPHSQSGKQVNLRLINNNWNKGREYMMISWGIHMYLIK